MPTSPCPTTWALPVSLLCWSMRMITGPSSANLCTTSASQKTQLLGPRCSASWWVSFKTAVQFVWGLFLRFDWIRWQHALFLESLFYCGCVLGVYSVDIRVLIIDAQNSCGLILNLFLLPVVTASILSLWQRCSRENAPMIYLYLVFYASASLSCSPPKLIKVVLFPVSIYKQIAPLLHLNISFRRSASCSAAVTWFQLCVEATVFMCCL